MSDDSEFRDFGPYTDADQAMRQHANWSAGMPVAYVDPALMAVQEALHGTRVKTTPFEHEYLRSHGLDPIMATIVAGWLIRASIAGRVGVVEQVTSATGEPEQ